MNTSSRLDFRDRSPVLTELDTTTFDLVVVGGGITGAGVARDAAMRGLQVALVEAADFASGTSSRSSKLAHGGMRYLSQGDVGLVREAATERLNLRQIAPHLAQLMPFVIPARSRAGIATFRTGMWTFEKLGKVPDAEKHTVWSKQELARNEPAIDSSAYHGAVVYSECLTEDSRLTLANIRSAKSNGAVVINYTRVINILTSGGRASGVRIQDVFSQQTMDVKARVVVNAAGPWVDAIRHLEGTTEPDRLQLTKGIHVVVPRTRLPIERTIIFPALDKRSVFAIPKDDHTYIGTTDTFYPDSDYWPGITADDVSYLLNATNRILTSPALGPDDVSAVWSGVRPLISEKGKSPSDISRKDEVWSGPAGVLSIAGGKLTAYRKMAERIVDKVQELMGMPVSECQTHLLPLPGGEESVSTILEQPAVAALSQLSASRLVRLYGTEAVAIADEGTGIAAEVKHSVLAEGAVTLEDYWVRRSARAWFNTPDGNNVLTSAADTMAYLLNWSEATKAAQIQSCQLIQEQSMQWRSNNPA